MRLRNITDLGGGGVRFLLLTLVVAAAALAGLTLSAAAQTGDDGADDADPQGRIIARIQDRTDDDGVDDYRIEFGFFPQWAMEDKDPWAEAITTWSSWLPRARYLTKTVIDRRDADDNRRWLRSSLISVPAGPSAQQDGGPDADFEGGGDDQQDLIEGRVVARYNPDSRGRLRVEFGFLPECAFESTSNTEEAVEQYGEDLLPRARYLSASMVESRRGVWLRSSVVDVPPVCEPPPPPCTIEFTSPTIAVVRGEQNENRRIGSVRCDVTDELTPISVMGTPSGLTIRVVSTGPGPWNLTLSGAATADAGSYPVEITVRPAQGDPVPESVTIRVTTSPPPRINWEGYDPDEVTVLGDDPPSTENLTVVDAESDQPVSPRPRITYEVDEAAEEVCDVNRNNGRITPLAAGVCIVVARSAETDQYAAGESDPVRVTITRVDPDLRWDGYDEEDLRPGGDPVRPREPQPRVSEARGELSYTYSATPSSICAVNSRTGDLTLHREGECDVTVRSAETNKFRTDQVTVTVQVDPPGPDCDDSIPDVGPLEPGQISRQINLDTYCDGEDLRYEVRSDNPTVASVRRIGSALTVTADDAPTDDRTEIIVTVTDRGGRGQSTEVRFDVLVEPVRPPEVLNVNCSPSRAKVNENVTCTVSLDRNGGMPDTYSWSGGNSRGPSNSERYITTFAEAGRQPVDLTVSNAAGSDRGSTTVTVEQQRPEIIRVICPSSADVGEDVTCTALLRGGEPDDDGWNWSGGDSSGSSETYDTSFSSSGDKTVRLTVRNSAGSDSASTSVRVQPPPRIDSISCSPSRPDVDENVTCTARLSGGDPDSYSWSGGDSSSSSATYRTSFSSSGDKTVRLTVRNTAGSDSDSTSVTVPPPPPVIVSNSISCSPSSPTVNQSVTCTASLSGGTPDIYSWSGGDSSGSSATYRTSFSSAGTKTVRFTVRNAAGSDSGSTSVIVIAAPVINSISCPSSAAVNENITCTVSLSGGTPDTYSWTDSDGGSGSSSSYRTSFSTADTYTVSLTVRNTGGDDSDTSRSITVTRTVDPPQVSVDCPSSADVNERIQCTYSRTSGDPATSWSWSDSDGGLGSSSSYSVRFTSAGTKTVYLTTSNSGGSGRRSQDSVIVADPPVAPTINSISCSPSSPTVDQSVTCSASLSGDAPTSYSWSGGSSSGNSASYSTSFSSSGSKTVRLTVRNSAGSDSDSYSGVTVQPRAPQVSISCPSSAEANDRIECTWSLTGGDRPTSWSWSDSDGGSGSSSSYRVRFTSTGTKTVYLTASNTGGSDSRRQTSVTVTEQAPWINSITCPSATEAGSTISCTASTGGGRVATWAWSGANWSGNTETYSARFSAFGRQTVRLTVSNSGGSDSDSTRVQVVATPPSTLYGRCGSDATRVYYFERATYTKRHLNMTWEEVAARVPGWGEHMIGHMSQSACNSWPTGLDVTTSNW